jgi:tRNA-specific 2-thiouridylase
VTGSLRVVAALSGGVDSAVAAARAIDAGHEVVGVHLALAEDRTAGPVGGRGCCTLDDANDARRAADVLGIGFYIWDLSAEFRREVVDDFVAEYAAGRTPNPCMRCNEAIKFSALLDRAVALGFDAVCTGHYARIVPAADGSCELHRATDQDKDQSYVLAVLTQDQLGRAMFPLGDCVKADVRAEAAARGLLVAAKPDSVDICFIPDGDTTRWLRQRLGDSPGPIVDAQSGAVLGTHDGAYQYTIGQRKGLGIRTATPDGAPRYVVAVDTTTRTVSVGPPSLLTVDSVTAKGWRWLNEALEVGRRCSVQVRAHGDPVAAQVGQVSPGSITVVLQEQLRGVATGQTLALYDGSRVLGSGTIFATALTREADPGS